MATLFARSIFFSPRLLDRSALMPVSYTHLDVYKRQVFIHSIFNSFKVAAVTTGISLLIGGMAAYAFTRLRFRGSNMLMILALFIQLLPTVSLVIPLYETVSRLGMIDRIVTLVVLYLGMVMAYAIWVLHVYFKSIPPDLEDAARIDGCNYFQAFLRIIVPLAKPGYVAVGTLVFLMCWDEFLYALIFMNSKETTTLTVALSQFSTTHGGIDYGMLIDVYKRQTLLWHTRHSGTCAGLMD